VYQPPNLFRGFLYCYYENVYGTRPITRELQHSLVWYYCGLNKPSSKTIWALRSYEVNSMIRSIVDCFLEFFGESVETDFEETQWCFDLDLSWIMD